jgi:hypothetical protein
MGRQSQEKGLSRPTTDFLFHKVTEEHEGFRQRGLRTSQLHRAQRHGTWNNDAEPIPSVSHVIYILFIRPYFISI